LTFSGHNDLNSLSNTVRSYRKRLSALSPKE
jgi:hypothetical protein